MRQAWMLVVLLCWLVAGCSRDPEQLKAEYVASGDQFFAQKKYAEAVIQYRNALAQDARSGAVRYKLAKAAEANGDVLAAFNEYIRAADLMPADVEAQISAGHMLLLAKKYSEARARATAVLEKEPRNVIGLVLMGNALAGLRDFDGAVSELENAIDSDPRRTLSYANLGVVAMAKGDKQAAEAAFKRAVESQPQSSSAHLSLGNYYWAASRLSEAEVEFKAAFALEPGSPGVLRGLSAFYLINQRKEAETYLKLYADSSADTGPKFLLADFYWGRGRTTEATVVLEQLAMDKQSFVSATARLAAIAYSAGDRPQGYQSIDAALQRDPKNEQALLVKARFLLIDGKPADALALMTRLVEANPRSAQGLYYKALALEASGATNQAAGVLQELLRQAPSAVPAQLKLAELYLARGDAKGASDLASQALKADPTSGAGHLLLAQAMLRQGNLTQAASELDVVARANPNSAQIENLFGAIYARKGDTARARASFARALELEPGSLDALAGLLRADLAEKKPEAARTRILAQLEKAPDNVQLLTLAGATLSAIGDQAQAETVFRKVIEKDPTNFQAYGSLGNLYVAQRRLDDAKKQFEESARVHPATAVGARTMIGTILAMQNKPAEARREWEKALALDPQAAVAANNLAWNYAESGDNLDVALQLAQTAKAQLPNSADVSDTLGWVYYKKDLATLAITALREGATQDPANPMIHYHLGLAYAKNGNQPEAHRSLEHALKLNPQFAGADDAKRVLGTLKG